MKFYKMLCLLLLTVFPLGVAQAETIEGTYQGHVFLVETSGSSAINLTWQDGTEGFLARRNLAPQTSPRCMCDVFDGPDGRRVLLERDPYSSTGYLAVFYQRYGSEGDYQTVTGSYDQYDFIVRVGGITAELTWMDGTQGFAATLDPHPVPAPRCICHVFTGPEGRQIFAEIGSDGTYISAIYSR